MFAWGYPNNYFQQLRSQEKRRSLIFFGFIALLCSFNKLICEHQRHFIGYFNTPTYDYSLKVN